MAKIKPLAKKYRLPRWMRQLLGIKPKEDYRRYLADIDEMHTVPVEPPTMYFICPCCGARTPMEARRPRPNGRTIAQTIIDEVPPTDYQKKAIEFLKELAPGYPEHTYKLTAVNLEAMHQSSPYDELIGEISKRLNDSEIPYSAIEMNIKVVDEEEHSKIHQSHKL